MNCPGMTLHVSLYIVPGDESFATQSTVIWSLLSITFQVFYWVVPDMDSLQDDLA